MVFRINSIAALLSVLFGGTLTTHSQTAKRPNILVILTDDQGYHDVSYYGTDDVRTPHIDQLIAAGMRFDNFYANSPVCSPTRAALMTGRYPDRVGVPGVIRTYPEDNWGYLDTSASTLPEALRTLDYHTALIGKWHLGLEHPNLPNDRGFDYFKGWLGDMMDDYTFKRRHGINYMRRNEEMIDPPGHATDLFSHWSVDYIQERAVHDQPFFLYLAFNAPHFPVQPPDQWLARVKARNQGISDKRALLVAHIEHLDDAIGKVVDALKETGQFDNTLIFFMSDNGGWLADEANNGPYRDGKQSVYEGGLRVPAGVVWKNHIEQGGDTPHPALTMDVFPTIMDLVGVSGAPELDGRSFAQTLMGETVNDDRALYFVRREGGSTYGGLTIQAVQLDGWKLLQNSPFGKQELYDLKEDPYEQRNVIADFPEKRAQLQKLLMSYIQQGGQVPWQAKERN